MHRILSIILLLSITVTLLISCESTSKVNEAAATTVNRLIQTADIEQNEAVIEPDPYSWKLKYLEIPEGCEEACRQPEFHTPSVYYFEDENIFRVIHRKLQIIKENRVNKIIRGDFVISSYTLTGEVIEHTTVKTPDGSDPITLSLCDDGFYISYMADSVPKYAKYSFETGEYDVIFEDLRVFKTDAIFNSPVGFLYHNGVHYFLCEQKLLGISDGGEIVFDLNRTDEFFDFYNEYLNITFLSIFLSDGIVCFRNSLFNVFTVNTETMEPQLFDYPGHMGVFGERQFANAYSNASIAGTPTRPVTFTPSLNNSRIIGGYHDLYYIDTSGIYSQNFIGLDEPEVPELMLDFNASGINLSTLTDLKPITDKCIYAAVGSIFIDNTENQHTSFPAILLFDEAATQRRTVTLAHAESLHPDVSSAITYFNMTSGTYRIKTVDYSSYNTKESPNGAIDQLLKEFGAGKYPDLLLIPNGLDYNNLVRKGFMYNLYDLGFDGEKLVGPVREMSEFAGELYKLPMSFGYTALLSRNGISSLSLTDLIQLYSTHGNRLFPQLERDKLIEYLFAAGALGKFIDYDNAKCDFNNAEFIEFLEFLRSYDNEMPQGASIGRGRMTSNENIQLTKGGDGEFFVAETNYYNGSLPEYGFLFDGGYTFCGLPTTNGSGIVITTDIELGITKASANPEGAMEFLMLLFDSDEAAEYMWKYTHLCSNGEILTERLENFYGSGLFITYYSTADSRFNTIENRTGFDDAHDYIRNDPNNIVIDVTREDIDAFTEAILNADVHPADDVGVTDIISDELTPFLAGQDTAENVAYRINSRVGIYLAERYS